MSQPTPEQVRNARHNGFVKSIRHLPVEKQQRLANSYGRQDANRERNIATFVSKIKGQ